MKTFYLFLTLLALLMLSSPISAQQTVQLFDEYDELALADSMSFLYETGNELTINDAMQRQGEFQRFLDGNPNFGFHDDGAWLRVSVTNVSDVKEWVVSVNFSQLDKVDFYLVQNGQIVDYSRQGKTQRDQTFRMPTFNVTLPYAEAVDLYVRVESQSSSLIVPLELQSGAMHDQGIQIDSLLWGLFYGGLVILAIYNLVLYFGVREPSLLAYVGYILAVIMWQLVWGGHVHLFSAGGLPDWLVSHTELIFVVIGISSGIFTLTFLETGKNAPRIDPIIKLMLVVQAIVGLACLPDLLPPIWKHNVVYGVGMVAICSYIFAGFEAFFNRFRPAQYFIFAWTMLAAGALAGMLSLIGLLPSNDFTAYCFQVGVFLEAGLFSIALMEKSRRQLESEVEQATNDLRNNMELIEEQNARLDIARKDAIKASNVKSQFLANMSHEIRTPLNAILGFSRELSQSALPSDQQEQVRIINTAADNLLSIVNDVLDFSKIEAGKLTINNQPFSPNELLEEMVTIMSKSAHSKRLEFVFELSPLPEKLIGDMFRIKQILNNLLSNAIKFTSAGMITLSAHAKPLAHGIHELEFRVEDTGIGISRKDRKKLFNAFSQVEDAINRSYQGTGLGLVICRELVRLMRGNITLKSVPNVGSAFTVSLKTNQLSQKFSLAPNSDWEGKKVVIFDPIPHTRRASAHMLSCLGAEVYAVETIAYLKRLTITSDYLLATLPVSKLSSRDALLSELVQIPAAKRILWYSGPEPFSQYPSLQDHFISQLRMPMTVTKLDSIVHQRERSNRNPMQDKLDSLPKARILAVDDMDMNLKLLHTWLDISPISLTTSMSGQDAVNRCQSNEYDLILMDVQMPGMDGLQASRGIRQLPLNMGTPIIAVTAHAFKEEQERLLASGMDDYLPKPIDLATLIDLIRRWCQNIEPVKMALPTLDWQLALKRSNHNSQASEELLGDFLKLLPSAIRTIKAQWEKRNYEALQSEVHRLHGACCYTGVPRLQDLARELESALKLGQHFLVAEHMPALITEAEIICAEGHQYLESHAGSAF